MSISPVSHSAPVHQAPKAQAQTHAYTPVKHKEAEAPAKAKPSHVDVKA